MKLTKKDLEPSLKRRLTEEQLNYTVITTTVITTTVITIQGIIEYLNLGMFNATVLQDHLIIPVLGMSFKMERVQEAEDTLDILD